MRYLRFTNISPPFFLILALLISIFAFSHVRAATTDLLLSEYIEGSSNNKAIEIYNGTGAAIDLGASGYNIQMYFNGSATAGLTLNLTGNVATGDVFVLAQSTANATILAQADQTSAASWYNGDDAIVLRKGTTVLDVFGQIGLDPGTEWGTALTSTADNTLRRKATVCVGDIDGTNAFDPAGEWDGFAQDTFDGLGSHTASCDGSVDTAPTVTAVNPANGASNVAVNANVELTFSEPVTLSSGGLTLSCATSGPHSAVVSGGPIIFTLNPDTDFVAGESCTVTVLAANVSDQDVIDPPDTLAADFTFSFTTLVPLTCDAPFTPIGQIQGVGNAAAMTGTLTTQGVVVSDNEGPSPTLRGFYLQDVAGDGNAETSDGLFVFNGGSDSVSLGQVVRVLGSVTEFQNQTQLTLTTLADCGTTATPTPVEVTLPFPAPVNGIAYLERFEGMLVRLPQTLYVTEHFQLGRFGQVVLSSASRLYQPTHLAAPGAPANAIQADNNRNRIILDDALQSQNPDPILFGRGGLPLSASNTLRGGDSVSDLVGVLTYTWGGNAASPNAYRLRPINVLGGGLPNFQPANARPSASPTVTGTLTVASFNVLNYFLTLGTGVACGPTASLECRGAENPTEFARQRDKLLQALVKLDADIVGLIELENTTGVEPLADIVTGLNGLVGTDTYAYINTGTIGTDAIKVGLIYKPGVVTPVGLPLIDTASIHNRPPLAQTFAQGDATFTVIVNHFKSKGCGDSTGTDADQGDGQGCFNAQRTQQATALVSFINSTVIRTAGDEDVLLLGDFNSYAQEDPITTIKGAGFADLVANFGGATAYSYVFDGQWGYLDYALASASLVDQVGGATDYHINADEPSVIDYNTNFKSPGQVASLYAPDEFRTSDHDPVLVGLNLRAPVNNVLMLSFNLNGTVGGVSFRDEDVLAYDAAAGTWGILFDGSNVGLGNADVDAFAVLDNGHLLLSVSVLAYLPQLGLVDGTDIIEFIPTSLGPNNTSGSFRLFFDGSDVGLITLIHDVDSIDFDATGNLLISVRGPFFAQGVRGNDEDLFRLRNGVFGPNTGGAWELAFDGSDVGLSTFSEDTRDTWTDTDTGELYLTNNGSFRTTTGFTGKPADVFICTPISLGANTACNFSSYFVGNSQGLSGKAIDGLHIGPLPAFVTGAGVLDPALDDTVEAIGDDIDAAEEADETSGPDEDTVVEQNNRIFLPTIQQ